MVALTYNHNKMPEVQLSAFYAEFIGFILTLITGLAIRDMASSFVQGMKFKMHKAFNEGDRVLLDSEPAMIIKIGFTETVFGVYGENGYTWRYIPNAKIASLKLEKIVDPDLHPDSKEERAQKLLDAMGGLSNHRH